MKHIIGVCAAAILLAAMLAGCIEPPATTGAPTGTNGTTAPTTAPTQQSTVPPTVQPTQPTTTPPTEATEPEPVAAPDFTVQDWDGNEVKLSDYLGKPIVLNFWAHWCGPCQMEMPEFNTVYEELGGEVTFLMVHEGAAVEDGKEKVTEGGYTFPVVFDADSSAGNLYGITAFPTTFFIDAEGNLQAYYMGAMDRALLQQGIDLIYTAE